MNEQHATCADVHYIPEQLGGQRSRSLHRITITGSILSLSCNYHV